MFPSSTSNDSASSSSSSSPLSHFPNNNNNNNNNNKSMEDVWEDINITSLPNTPLPHHNHYTNQVNNTTINIDIIKNININHIIHHPTPTSDFRGMILQDFLNCNNPLITTVDHHHDNQQSEIHHQQQTPLTTLNLNNPVFDPQNYSAFAAFDDTLIGSSRGRAVPKKRSSGSALEIVDQERRQQRMIRNRESAARSRARKQAHVNELEVELANLSKENRKLRKQHRELIIALRELPQKHSLIRSQTAPF